MKTGIYKNVDKVFSGPEGALNTLLCTTMTERIFFPSKTNILIPAVCTGLISIQLAYYAIVDQAHIFWVILAPVFIVFVFALLSLARKGPSLHLTNDGIFYEPWKKDISSNFAPWDAMEDATELYRFRMNLIAIKVNQSVKLSKFHQVMYGNRLIIMSGFLKGKKREICDEINQFIHDKKRQSDS